MKRAFDKSPFNMFDEIVKVHVVEKPLNIELIAILGDLSHRNDKESRIIRFTLTFLSTIQINSSVCCS